MKFENKGKWVKEAEDKMASRDTMENPDYLEGDHKVITFEDEELNNTPSDKEFEEEYLDESSQKNEVDNEETYKIEFKKLVMFISAGIGRYVPTTYPDSIRHNSNALSFIATANEYAQKGDFDRAVKLLKQAKSEVR